MSHETLQAFLAHFPSPRKSGAQWIARCPAHDDHDASLAIGEGQEGRILLHCHAGCSTDAVLIALGLDETALFAEPPPQKSTIVATYPYRDEQGVLLYESVRFEPKDFRQRRPDGHGGWIWNTAGVRRVVYRLPELIGKIAIVIVEGEKDADAAWALGVPATTNVCGAGNWKAEYSQQLAQIGVRRAAIIPDADIPGRKHANEVAASVTVAGIEARMAVLPEMPPKGDLSDYLKTHTTKADLVALLRDAPPWTPGNPVESVEPTPSVLTDFRRTPEGRYTWAMLPPGIMFELDRVRRDHHELCGELTVRCDLSGISRTQSGAVLTAEFNLSSARARVERAKLLSQRAKTGTDVDWMAALEEFCERVFEAERQGNPAIRLDEGDAIDRQDVSLHIDGITLLEHHPIILFGDGGTAKSYLALYLAGRLAQDGHRVLYADWELLPDEHRTRLRRLFGPTKPRLWYVTCERPLVAEQDRLLKIIRAEKISYLIVDSVAVACDGPPEAAEITTAYFRAVRSFGNVGSLHLAHTNRSDQADKKPFGSSFWHNLARSTWFCRRTEENEDPKVLTIGLFNRKANLGPLQRATGFTFRFTPDHTDVSSHDIQDIPELAGQMPTWQRMQGILISGPMTRIAIANELGVKENSITQAVRRHQRLFERTTGVDGIQRIRLIQGLSR